MRQGREEGNFGLHYGFLVMGGGEQQRELCCRGLDPSVWEYGFGRKLCRVGRRAGTDHGGGQREPEKQQLEKKQENQEGRRARDSP